MNNVYSTIGAYHRRGLERGDVSMSSLNGKPIQRRNLNHAERNKDFISPISREYHYIDKR